MHCTPLRYSVALRPSAVIANRWIRRHSMRIVSLLASATEIVCALGAGEMLVGRSHECDNPEWVRRLPGCTGPALYVSGSNGEIYWDGWPRVPASQTPCSRLWGHIVDSVAGL